MGPHAGDPAKLPAFSRTHRGPAAPLALPTWRRHSAGLARRRTLRPQLAQRILKHGREVEAVGGPVAAGGQTLLLQRLQRRIGRQHRLPVTGPALVVCRQQADGECTGWVLRRDVKCVALNCRSQVVANPFLCLPAGQRRAPDAVGMLAGRVPGHRRASTEGLSRNSPPKCLDTYTMRAAAPEAEPGEPAPGGGLPPGLPPGLPALLSRYTSTHSSPASWPVGAATTTRHAPVLSGTRSRTSHCATAALRSCVEWRAVMAAAAARSAEATRVSSRGECSGSADSTDR